MMNIKTWRAGGPRESFPFSKAIVPVLACLVLSAFPGPAPAKGDVRDSIVKLYTVQNRPDYDNPWNPSGARTIYGSGCVIRGNRILTNAHMVSDRTFLQVRRHGKTTRHTARVLAVSHAADLALLVVDDPGFFNDIAPLELGELPEVQQDVMVYGFPCGGDMLSSTKGVISRTEHCKYVHSTQKLLAAQLDAAVNPGNSGGPVVVDDRLVGIVMQGMREAQNISYMVPVPVVRHFLADVEDGRRDGFPEDGLVVQAMENTALKKKYGLRKDQSGVLVTAVLPGTPAEGRVVPGDVILAADGYDIADDGTVEFRPGERTSLDYCVQRHQVGEELVLDILRQGEKETVSITLTLAWGGSTLIPMPVYDVMPTYYIYGGLVFMPLTRNYLATWDASYREPPANLARYLVGNMPGEKGEEVVILSQVLAADVNNGYKDYVDRRVTKVNGRGIKNLKELIRVVEGTRGAFIDFECEGRTHIVLDREVVEDRHGEILETYQVPSDRSKDLGDG